jgi:hypothetical protein
LTGASPAISHFSYLCAQTEGCLILTFSRPGNLGLYTNTPCTTMPLSSTPTPAVKAIEPADEPVQTTETAKGAKGKGKKRPAEVVTKTG